MKISKLQFIIIISFFVFLTIIIIILNRSVSRSNITVQSETIETVEETLPQAGKFELPTQEQENIEEKQAEKELPIKNLSDITEEELPKEVTPTEKTAETEAVPQKTAGDNFRKYPSPEQLRNIKAKGLVIY